MLLGDRWTLLVLRDMLLGGRSSYSDFAHNEEIASNVLADRLRRLVDHGLIAREPDPHDGRKAIYRPLAPAIELVPVLAELVAWGLRHTAAPSTPAFAPLVDERSRHVAVEQTVASLTAALAQDNAL